MSTSSPVALDVAPVKPMTASKAGRYFYSGAAVVLLVMMFLGFQQFYLHGRSYPGREIPPPIRTLIIAHGVSMTLWVLLFVVQPVLIASRNYRVHMLLGKIGAALALGIFVLGIKVGIESTRISPPEMQIWRLTPKQFMAIPIISITAFAVFVAVGVWQRRRPEIHRPMMLLASLVAIPAAVSRIDALNALYVGTIWETLFGPFFSTLVIGAVLVAIKCVITRAFDRWLVLGFVGLTLLCAAIMQIATTPAWERLAGWMVG